MRVTLHLVIELHFALAHHARDRRGRVRLGRRRQRNVPFAGEQSRRRIEPDPSGAGQIDFGPGVQVGEIVGRARRTLERLHVGLELDQVAGDEARRQPRWRRICTSSQAVSRQEPLRQRQRFLGSLHARLHADQVADLPLQPLIQVDQKIDRPHLLAVDANRRNALSSGAGVGRLQERRQLLRLPSLVHERDIARRTAPGRNRTD